MKSFKYLLTGLLLSSVVFAQEWYQPDPQQTNSVMSSFDFGNYDESKYRSVINEALGRSDVEPQEKIGEYAEADTTLYFATFAMSDTALTELLYSSTQTGGTVVFKGVKEQGGNIGQGIAYLQKLIQDPRFEKVPNVILNPTYFTDYMIKVAPTIVYQKKGAYNAYKVSGLIDASWLHEKVEDSITKNGELKDGELFDYGVMGPTYFVIEKDLIADMKQRVEQYDWEAAKKAALDRYFNQFQFFDLPASVENQERELDLNLVVKRDITDDKGNVIAKKGQVINPNDYMSLSKYIVVFDPTKEGEIEFAKKMAIKAKADNKGIKYIITNINKSKGIESIGLLMNKLGSTFTVIDQFIKDRFAIKSTPSIIYTKDKKVYIQEVVLTP